MMALRLREVKELAQGHPAGKWQRQDAKLSLSIDKALHSTSKCFSSQGFPETGH